MDKFFKLATLFPTMRPLGAGFLTIAVLSSSFLAKPATSRPRRHGTGVAGLKLIFSEHSWDDYLYWQRSDRKILERLNKLIKEIQRTPFAGTGKPESLRLRTFGKDYITVLKNNFAFLAAGFSLRREKLPRRKKSFEKLYKLV